MLTGLVCPAARPPIRSGDDNTPEPLRAGGKNRKPTSSVHAVFCSPVWCHSTGKTNEEPNHPLIVFRFAIIRKHKLDMYPSVVLWVLCSSYKTLTKAKNMRVFPHSERVIRKRKSPLILYRIVRP